MNQIETNATKPKATRKKQPKEMSIDVIMEGLTLEVPADESDTMNLIKDAEKEIRPETKLKRARKSKVVEIQQYPAAVVEVPYEPKNEEVKDVISSIKKSNPWINHIRAFAKENNLTYNKAMLHGDLKKSYVKVVSAKNIQTVP
jgi:hypothetical protein